MTFQQRLPPKKGGAKLLFCPPDEMREGGDFKSHSKNGKDVIRKEL